MLLIRLLDRVKVEWSGG